MIEDYQSLPAPEVWLVYPEERRVRRLLLESGKLIGAGTYGSGPLAPQFAADAAVDLNELWAGRAIRP